MSLPVKQEQVLSDIKRVWCALGKPSPFSHAVYMRAGGRYHRTTILRVFSGWGAAIEKAGYVEPEREINTDEIIAAHKNTKIQRDASNENKMLRDELIATNERAGIAAALNRKPTHINIARRKTSNRHRSVAVAMASDWHFEEVVESEKVMGLNTFNLEIAHERAKKFFSGFVRLTDILRYSDEVAEGVLALGGDLVTGQIHEDLSQSNSLSTTEALIELQDVLTAGIRFLLKDGGFKKLHIPCTFGNHGRTNHGRPMLKMAAENSYEWLLYHQLEREFRKDVRVQFDIRKSAYVPFEVYGYRMLLHHGDHVKGGQGIGGVMVPVQRKIHKLRDNFAFDCLLIGHFHQYQSARNCVMNGSLIGASEYGLSLGLAESTPSQAFFAISEKYRQRTIDAPIFVEEPK
jgi:hypothetical protein